MHDTTIAAKLLGQLESFLGRISPHFHKPVARFIGDMVYGIMVEKGYTADLAVLDPETFDVCAVFVDGEQHLSSAAPSA